MLANRIRRQSGAGSMVCRIACLALFALHLLLAPGLASQSNDLSSLLDNPPVEGQINTLIIPSGTWYVDHDLTVSETMSMQVEQDAYIHVKEEATLKINGKYIAPGHHIFIGKGAIQFGVLPGREVNPAWWGAKGDGVRDDTAAIQSAINAIPQGNVLLDKGVFILSPTRRSPDIAFLLVKPNIVISGQGAGRTILKVKDHVGPYHFILTNPARSSDCSNLRIANLSIDSNIANNPIDSESEIKRFFRISIGIYSSNNILIDSVEFINESSINTVAILGSTSRNVKIVNCRFNNIGDDPNHVKHDHSSIYTHASNVLIRKNYLRSAGLGRPGARTAIETHGSDTVVEENTIIDYLKGMNITGIHLETSQNVHVRGNQIHNANYGIYIWSLKYRTHVVGYGLEGITIVNNNIIIAQTRYPLYSYSSGIFINPISDLPIKDIEVRGNTIRFDHEKDLSASSINSFGIGYVSSRSAAIANCKIVNNVIENAPSSGIRFSCIAKGLNIEGNTVVNPGSAPGKVIPDQYRVGIHLDADKMERVEIKNNSIIDNLPRPRMVSGLHVVPGRASNSVWENGNTVSFRNASK